MGRILVSTIVVSLGGRREDGRHAEESGAQQDGARGNGSVDVSVYHRYAPDWTRRYFAR